MAGKANGTGSPHGKDNPGAAETPIAPGTPGQIDAEVAGQIARLRASVRENFGKAVMALMLVPRYRSQTLGDLQHIILEPLLRDRLAIAYPGKTESPIGADMSGFAIWASVSEEVDRRIREQVREGVFPVRLRPEDWNSGPINWLLDVIAPDPRTVTSVIANFRQVAREGDLRLHPIITRLVDKETLEKLRARRNPAEPAATAAAPG